MVSKSNENIRAVMVFSCNTIIAIIHIMDYYYVLRLAHAVFMKISNLEQTPRISYAIVSHLFQDAKWREYASKVD